jgi:uncharacterized membrane protein YagU involved in acid resistance
MYELFCVNCRVGERRISVIWRGIVLHGIFTVVFLVVYLRLAKFREVAVLEAWS